MFLTAHDVLQRVAPTSFRHRLPNSLENTNHLLEHGSPERRRGVGGKKVLPVGEVKDVLGRVRLVLLRLRGRVRVVRGMRRLTDARCLTNRSGGCGRTDWTLAPPDDSFFISERNNSTSAPAAPPFRSVLESRWVIGLERDGTHVKLGGEGMRRRGRIDRRMPSSRFSHARPTGRLEITRTLGEREVPKCHWGS